MVNGVKKNVNRCCAMQRKASITIIGIEKPVKKLNEPNREHARQMEDGEAVSSNRFKAQSSSTARSTSQGCLLDAKFFQNVHEALRQHDPMSKAPSSQPSLPKKAPPTTGKGMPAGFYRGDAPPRIGSEQVQPAPPPKLPGSTPTTPAHPPRPPISALPQPVQEPPAPATLKHALPQPAQQGPPNKQTARRISQEISKGIRWFH